VGLCYSPYYLRKEVEVVGRHWRTSSRKKEALEILKGPTTCFRDINKGEKLRLFFSAYVVERSI